MGLGLQVTLGGFQVDSDGPGMVSFAAGGAPAAEVASRLEGKPFVTQSKVSVSLGVSKRPPKV